MADDDRLQQIASRVIDDYVKGGLARLTPRDQVFFLAWAYAAELDGGGHAAFFYNSEADNYAETLDALRQLDLPLFADLLSRAAVALFQGEVPRNMMERNAIIDAIPEQAGPTDDELARVDQEFDANGGSAMVYDALARWTVA